MCVKRGHVAVDWFVHLSMVEYVCVCVSVCICQLIDTNDVLFGYVAISWCTIWRLVLGVWSICEVNVFMHIDWHIASYTFNTTNI